MRWPGLPVVQIPIHPALGAQDRPNFCPPSYILFDNSRRLGFSGIIHVPGISESLARVVLSTVPVLSTSFCISMLELSGAYSRVKARAPCLPSKTTAAKLLFLLCDMSNPG